AIELLSTAGYINIYLVSCTRKWLFYGYQGEKALSEVQGNMSKRPIQARLPGPLESRRSGPWRACARSSARTLRVTVGPSPPMPQDPVSALAKPLTKPLRHRFRPQHRIQILPQSSQLHSHVDRRRRWELPPP